MSEVFKILLLISCLFNFSIGEDLIEIKHENYVFHVYTSNEDIYLELFNGLQITLTAVLGLNVNASSAKRCENVNNCYDFNEKRLEISNFTDTSIELTWSTVTHDAVLQDCHNLSKNVNWYGGPERFQQVWPIERLILNDFANVPKEAEFGAITEGYWLNSLGIYIYVHDKVPLFIDQNNQEPGYVCFAAKNREPFAQRDKIILKYTIGVFRNPREAHLSAVQKFLKKPSGHPNTDIIKNQIWSTWALYKRDITADKLINFAKEIVNNGYTGGQFEIDDDWEECYGSLTFNKTKFPDIKTTIKEIKSLGFSVSLWVHPFINKDCASPSQIAHENGYLAMNKNKSLSTSWWNSGPNEAQHIDFTKEEARNWFNGKLKALKDLGIDSFKFDAGESSWPPQPPVMQTDKELWPYSITTEYIRNTLQYGDLIEVRTGWRTQDLPIFVRMIDKDSNWGLTNGLYTLITTLLQMNMNGYTMVLPDMVGGNGYQGAPNAELFVRWLQANTFMPSIQFSYVPWNYLDAEFDVLKISRTFVDLHRKYSNEIVKAMNASVTFGHPVNPPIWWIDPQNPDALKSDTRENILVAPVIEEGHTSRTVYLPNGVWIDGNTGVEYSGNQYLHNYPAPITVLPYFLRKTS